MKTTPFYGRSMRCAAGLISVLFAQLAVADDWPQWMGLNRDSVWRETGIVKQFPDSGLPVKWRIEVGGGYSGPAVAAGRVFLTDYVARSGEESYNPGGRSNLLGKERILCVDALDGSILWKTEYDCPLRISYSNGPRATPTVDGDRVYTLGAEGKLLCLQTKTGQIVWSRNLAEDYQTETPIWGFSGHPLIDGDKLICLVGGSGSVAVAFDKRTGKELWKSLSAQNAGYCPPTMIRINGEKQLVIWYPAEINGLDPETGKVYWTVPLKPDFGMSIAAPRQQGDLLYAAGHQRVAAVLQVADRSARVVWRQKSDIGVFCSNSTPYIQDGIVYGVCGTQGQLRAVDLKTGKRLWQSFEPTTGGKRFGHGTAFIVKHQDRFFLFNEAGDLVLASLSPQGYREISRFHVLDPTTKGGGRDVVWTHPAFANKCVFARNDKELVCVSLAAK